MNRYAPVLITTLNRHEKFVECLESLERCVLATETDVYVAVDFPPAERYKPGWKKTLTYLENKCCNHSFRSLNIIKRERNYGIGKLNSNYQEALSELRQKYDNYIFSEDDNVFAPNFLLFMNEGLVRFKDDRRICMLSGYNYPFDFPPMYKNNFYITKNGSPWGMGGWFDRLDDIRKYYDLNFLKSLLRNDVTYKKLKKRRPETIDAILRMLKVNQSHGDACIGCYVAMEDKYWVLPTLSKVQNHGTDGSGAHATARDSEREKYYLNQKLDTADTFEFTNDIFTYRPVELSLANCPQKWYKVAIKKTVSRIDLFCLRKFGFVPRCKYI